MNLKPTIVATACELQTIPATVPDFDLRFLFSINIEQVTATGSGFLRYDHCEIPSAKRFTPTLSIPILQTIPVQQPVNEPIQPGSFSIFINSSLKTI